MRWLWLVVLLFTGICADAQSTPGLPAKPTRYVSDRAFVLDERTVSQLNSRLETFERETSNQVVVAIFGKLPVGAEIAQYSTQVFRSWQVGQAEKDNGVVLFIFKDDRKLFIATGRGMEGALPDVICKQIIENEIVPRFKAGDFPGGIDAGVSAIIAATKGEYHGNGKTAGDGQKSGSSSIGFGTILMILWVLFYLIPRMRRSGRDVLVNRGGYMPYGGGFFSGGGSSGGSSWGGGGGGGFSGGGGSSGGGGAGGSW